MDDVVNSELSIVNSKEYHNHNVYLLLTYYLLLIAYYLLPIAYSSIFVAKITF
jgi:hypothetical protein